MQRSASVVDRPQKLRLRGELRLKCTPGGKTQFEDVERDFRDAVELAWSMSAKSLESSATTSLARLLRDTDEGRALLADIYNWFTEGFDTSDLKDAQGLLEQLSQ
jgi:predicted ATPase